MFHRLPTEIYARLGELNTVLLETNKFDSDNYESLLFSNPIKILTQSQSVTLEELIQDIESYLELGFYAAGYVSYEACCNDRQMTILPTAWFGIYEKPWIFDHRVGGEAKHLQGGFAASPSEQCDSTFLFAGSNNSESTYKKGVHSVLQHIKRGDAYQVNLCGEFNLTLKHSPELLYRQLLNSFNSAYSAFISSDQGFVISLSPELFFSRDKQKITVAPMKGTARRGRTLLEDMQIAEALIESKKCQAENVMIVDLMRNDLTKIANNVRVRELFKLEKFLSLFQMTSFIDGELKSDISYSEIFKALFPSGSVTGAPKISSMEIIKNIEQVPRGVYTGAIGYFAPDSRAVFSVAIRTIEGNKERIKMGVGSGIVWDSRPGEEYEECLLKGNFVTSPITEFSLFETILWSRSYQNIDSHLTRLAESAEYFDYPFDLISLKKQLAKLEDKFGAADPALKVKVSLDRFGIFKLEYSPIVPWESRQIAVWPKAVSSDNRFFYHKTTNRLEYELAAADAQRNGLADYIFVNERGEITEGAISNIFIKTGDHYYTPPVTSGLLAGVYRKVLLNSLLNCTEQVITLEDLKNADEILICNSIRGVNIVSLLKPI